MDEINVFLFAYAVTRTLMNYKAQKAQINFICNFYIKLQEYFIYFFIYY